MEEFCRCNPLWTAAGTVGVTLARFRVAAAVNVAGLAGGLPAGGLPCYADRDLWVAAPSFVHSIQTVILTSIIFCISNLTI